MGNGKLPQLGEVLDWRKAAPSAKQKPAKATKPARPDGPGDTASSTDGKVPENANDVLPPIDPCTMAHFIAVQSALTPEEAALAREVAKELERRRAALVVRRAEQAQRARCRAEDAAVDQRLRQGGRCVVIGLPFNDLRCLGSVTEVVAELVTNRDEVLLELAEKYPTTDALAGYIRSLPQRDDDGDEGRRTQGRRVQAAAAAAPARTRSKLRRARRALHRRCRADRSAARSPARDARHTDRAPHVPRRERCARHPRSARPPQLPRLRRPVLRWTRRSQSTPRDAIEWTAQLAEAGAANFRNGPSPSCAERATR